MPVKPRLYSKDFKYVRAEDMDAQYLARRFRQIRAEQPAHASKGVFAPRRRRQASARKGT